MSELYFLHGMESSPLGTKSRLLLESYPNCVIPELPPDIRKREKILMNLIQEPAWFVGSSLGGLSALLFAMKKPGLVRGMVLMAPAVGFLVEDVLPAEDLQLIQTTYIPTKIPCTVIAGLKDEVVSLKSIETMIERSPSQEFIKYLQVDDDHFLNRSLDILLSELEKMVV